MQIRRTGTGYGSGALKYLEQTIVHQAHEVEHPLPSTAVDTSHGVEDMDQSSSPEDMDQGSSPAGGSRYEEDSEYVPSI